MNAIRKVSCTSCTSPLFKHRLRTALILLTSVTMLLLCNTSLRSAEDYGKSALAAALATGDITAIKNAVAESRRALGDKSGVPEVADKYTPVPPDARWLKTAEAQPGFSKYFDKLEKMRWWRIGIDPTKLTQPLRAPAAVLSGNLAAARAKLDGAERSLEIAKDAAEFLMWAQEQAGTGLFPFPAARGKTDDKAMAVADAFLAKAEKAGKLGDIVHNGWAVEDGDGGGLQFDNAECGVAMFELYEFTHDERVLASARRAADWAAARPLVSNWNYNSFSVWLLAKAHAVTGDATYLAAAKKKALLGVIPGQLTEGPHMGRWLDPHNARPAYHYIMLRALAQLTAVLPKDDPDRAAIVQALKLGLTARNQEILTQGVMTKDKAIEALLLTAQVFADERTFLDESKTTAVLDTLGRFVSAEALLGKLPLGPREWGMFLAHVKIRTPSVPAPIAAANLQTVTLMVDGIERRALVHVPPAYDGKAALPVVLMFHGNGGTAEAVIKEMGWVAKSDTAGFIVVFPEGTRPDMTQPPKFGPNNPAWNDGSGRFHAGERNISDVAFVAALLDHLETKFAVDKRRVFATGFSNGASMAFRVGLELSERIAAIAPVSGALWIAEPKASQPVSLLYITGTADPINPLEGGVPKMASGSGFKGVPEKAKPPVREMVRVWVKLLGCAPEAKPLASNIEGITTVVHAGGRDGTEVIFTTIEGQGHIWPGGKSPLPEFILGKATSRLNATDAVWEFFQAHPKPSTKP